MTRQPLSNQSAQWLQSFGTPNPDFLVTVLGLPKFKAMQEELEPLKRAAPALADAFNDAINFVINHNAEENGEQRSYRQLAKQLTNGEPIVMDYMRNAAATWPTPITLSDHQAEALLEVYRAWRLRLQHNIGAGGHYR